MAKIAVMGDYDSIYGFAALGLETYPVDSQEQGQKLLRQLAESDYAVIYMTEALAQQLAAEVSRYRTAMTPAIIRSPAWPGTRSRASGASSSPSRRRSAPISCSPINKKGG